MANKAPKCKKCVCKLIGWGLLLGLGVGLIVFGTIALQRDLLEGAYKRYIKEKFALRPHSEALYNWASVYKDHVTHNYYFFTVANFREVIKYGARPRLEEMGPYRYRVDRKRENIYFDVTRREEYLNFTLTDTYQFDSSHDDSYYHKEESDLIYTINLPMLTLAKELEKLKPKDDYSPNPVEINRPSWNHNNDYPRYPGNIDPPSWKPRGNYPHFPWEINPPSWRPNVDYPRYPVEPNPPRSTNKTGIPQEVLDLFKGESIIKKVTVGELLWGWESEALKKAKDIIKKIYNVSIVEDSTYGISYQSGQPKKTWKGEFSVDTGINYNGDINKVNYYNGKTITDRYCQNSVDGTDGTVTPPKEFYNWHSTKKIFAPDWCLGAVDLDYLGSVTDSDSHHSDLQEVYRLDSYPFYQNTNAGRNAENCSDNRPMSYSLPHFFRSTGNYDYFDGVAPTEDQHSTKYIFDKYTGYAYEYQRRFQYNVAVKHNTFFNETMKLFDGVMFPMAWKEEAYSVDNYGSYTWNQWQINKLSNEVKKVHAAATKWVPIGCIIGGSVLLLIFSIRFLVFFVRGCKACCKYIKETNRERVLVHTVSENVSHGYSRVRDVGKQFVVTLQRNKPGADDDVTLISDVNDQETPEADEVLNVA